MKVLNQIRKIIFKGIVKVAAGYVTCALLICTIIAFIIILPFNLLMKLGEWASQD